MLRRVYYVMQGDDIRVCHIQCLAHLTSSQPTTDPRKPRPFASPRLSSTSSTPLHLYTTPSTPLHPQPRHLCKAELEPDTPRRRIIVQPLTGSTVGSIILCAPYPLTLPFPYPRLYPSTSYILDQATSRRVGSLVYSLERVTN